MLTGNKDVDLKILNNLEDKDLVNLCSVNRYSRRLCNDEYFWLNRILKKFPYLSLEMLKQYKKDRRWADYYIKDLRKVAEKSLIRDESILEKSSRDGRLDQVMVAINSGANPKNYQGVYALLLAANEGYLDIVKYLVENGANISEFKELALTEAINNNHLDIVKYLITLGDSSQEILDNALYAAINANNLPIVKYLIQQGADIYNNNDFIMSAADKNHDEIVEYLISL